MYNRGTKYLEKGNALKALQCFKKQLTTHSFKELHLNMGNAYRLLMQTDKALAQYILANRADVPFSDGTYSSTYALATNNIGLLAYACGDDTTAISYYKAALEKDPLHYDAIWNYASALLRQTNCSSTAGWAAYEYRFKRSGATSTLDTSMPLWDGISSGKNIVVQTEQGLGDKIMFGRYLPLLASKFENVYVGCHEVLDVFYSDYKIIRGNASAPADAVTIGICSLAKVFGIVDEKWLDVGRFNAREFDRRKLNVGVVWSGSTTHANNHNRSCPSHYFSSLNDVGNIALYGLNPADAKAKHVTDVSSKDWATTISTVLGLDCVVSVDTSIVHLCGTLGVPCIMIQPTWETDFRWGKPGDKNVWYKSVDVIDNLGWERAIATVKQKLAAIKHDQRIRLQFGITNDELAELVRLEDLKPKYIGNMPL